MNAPTMLALGSLGAAVDGIGKHPDGVNRGGRPGR
jgi:hypothetical protein